MRSGKRQWWTRFGAILLTTAAGIATAKAGDAQESPGKTSEGGHWLEPRVDDMPHLPMGPFIRLEDRGILTVDATNALISHDAGKTWQQHPIFEDTQSYRIRPERQLIRTRNGVVILAFMNDAQRKWTWSDELMDAPGAVLPTYTVRSLDGGKTWEKPQKRHDEWTGAIRDIIQTEKGNVVFTSMQILHDPGRHAVLTYTSGDDGATWQRSNLIDLGGAGHHDGAMEATLVQLRDGRLWKLIRTTLGRFWQAHSTDERYWRELGPTKIEATSAPALIHRLESGNLVLFWNRPEKRRTELFVMFSKDDGQTWTQQVVIARKEKTSLAYPYLFEAAPGEMWVTTMQGQLRVKLHEADFIE